MLRNIMLDYGMAIGFDKRLRFMLSAVLAFSAARLSTTVITVPDVSKYGAAARSFYGYALAGPSKELDDINIKTIDACLGTCFLLNMITFFYACDQTAEPD
jgi:hypothetical protein